MSLNSYATIIWDWNGTLIDDVALCASLVTRALAERGIGPVSVEQYRAVYQHPIKNVYTALGAPLTDDEYYELTFTTRPGFPGTITTWPFSRRIVASSGGVEASAATCSSTARPASAS